MDQRPRPAMTWRTAIAGMRALATVLLAWCVGITGAMCGEAAPPVPGLSVADEPLLRRIVQVIDESHPRVDEAPPAYQARMERSYGEFIAALGLLGARADASVAAALDRDDADFPAVVVAIAQAFHRSPERWQTLLASYGKPAPGGEDRVAVPPPPLSPEHLAPPFRPFWELALLAPPDRTLRFMRPRIIRAIIDLKHAPALPLLVHLFADAAGAGAVEAGSELASVMARMDLDQSVPALADCLHAALVSWQGPGKDRAVEAISAAFATVLQRDPEGRRRASLQSRIAAEGDAAVRRALAEIAAKAR